MGDTVALSLGSNKGERELNIKAAVKDLEKKFKTKVIKSSVYETPPLYYEGPENFLNCCVKFETEFIPREIFDRTSSIEMDIGRVRTVPNAPRVIDIDIIFIDNKIIVDDDLTVPHPGMHERRFVLKPLSEIMSGFLHPAMDMTVDELLENCSDQSIIKKVKNFWRR